MLINSLAVLVSVAISAAVILVLIAKAEALGLVQAPVARSSHVKPTPTGGGLGIVVAAVGAGLYLCRGDPDLTVLLALASMMALLGLVDDRRPLAAGIRFPIQALLVASLVWLADGASILVSQQFAVLYLPACCFLAIAGLWWVNLYNFMDGIDGIAGQQAIFMLGAAMLAAVLQHGDAQGEGLWWVMTSTLGAVAAFLAFNWPPARIFMGDAGSTFLGFALFAFALLTVRAGWVTVPQWLLFAALFVVDATVTLITRFFRRERVTEAHRSHAYQRLSRYLGGARPVTSVAFAFNLLVLLPLALAISENDGLLAYGVVTVVYVLLAAFAVATGAGLKDEEEGIFIMGKKRD